MIVFIVLDPVNHVFVLDYCAHICRYCLMIKMMVFVDDDLTKFLLDVKILSVRTKERKKKDKIKS